MRRLIQIISIAIIVSVLQSCGSEVDGDGDSNDSYIYAIIGMGEVPGVYPDSPYEFLLTFDLDGNSIDSDGDRRLSAVNGTYLSEALGLKNFDIWISEYVGENSRWERERTLDSNNIYVQGNDVIFSFPRSYIPSFTESTPVAVDVSNGSESDRLSYTSNAYGVENFDSMGDVSDPKVDIRSYTLEDSYDITSPDDTGADSSSDVVATGVYAICRDSGTALSGDYDEGCHQYFTKGDEWCSDSAGTVCAPAGQREGLCVQTGIAVGITFELYSSGWGTFDDLQTCLDTCNRDSVVNFGGTCHDLVIE